MTRPVALRRGIWLGLALLLAASCSDPQQRDASYEIYEPTFPRDSAIKEEEVLGNLYLNGSKITSGNYYVQLERLSSTGGSLGATSMWVNPDGYTSGWMYGWFDTMAKDGPCRADAPGPEVHDGGLLAAGVAGASPVAGQEVHCVVTGSRYRFTLFNGDPSLGQVVKTFVFDYPRWLGQVWNYELSPAKSEFMESTASLTSATRYMDAYVSVDLAPFAAGVNDPELWVDNAGPSLATAPTTFHDDPTPSGTTEDYFRFSVSGTTYTTNITSSRASEPMARLWVYRNGTLLRSTNWYTFENEGVTGYQRVMRFSQAATYEVVLDIMRPDQAARTTPSANAARRTIVVTSPPPPPPPPDPVPTTLSLSPSDLILATDGQAPGSATVTATVRDQFGQPMSGLTFTWSTDDLSVARFKRVLNQGSPTGPTATVVAAGTGNTVIRVSTSGLSSWIGVQVNCHLTACY